MQIKRAFEYELDPSANRLQNALVWKRTRPKFLARCAWRLKLWPLGNQRRNFGR